jgi:hypothetical protein
MERKLREKCARTSRKARADQQDQTRSVKTKMKPLPIFLPITVEELEKAEDAIIKCSQAQAYGKETSVINDVMSLDESDLKKKQKQKKMGIKKTSSIHKLSPFLSQGILRVGGRLSRANLPELTKHPYILPQRSHITMLIIRDVHKRLGHAGRGHVMAALREKYWIMGANSAVRHYLYKCVICRRIQATPSEQRMSDLPKERVNPAPPFTYVGVDYFGPFHIKERRKVLKRYGALFTCLASRAIHVEVSYSLDTNSFIQALRRFIARRGPIRQIRCANGTNFIGAKSELSKAFDEMDQSVISSKMNQMCIEWIFNPPAASHMGGVWERQIRSVRKILAGILHENGEQLDDESFRTMLCEVEAIVNSRPLTFPSTDPNNLNPISPSDILTMKTKIILPPPGVFQCEDLYACRCWRRVQYLANLFWTSWKKEYLVSLQQ